MTPYERAERAKQLLDDPILKGAFAALRERLVSKLETTPFGDVDTQHHTVVSLQLLQNIQLQLRQYLNDAAVEEAKAKNDNWIARMRQSNRA